jgi:hypothetical protein
LERKHLDKLSPAPAGFVIRRNRTLFYNALDYKSNASLMIFIRPVNHAECRFEMARKENIEHV